MKKFNELEDYLSVKHGFTLVELAIVIVIIGLLVGGVLAGKELIKQASIRTQINQFQEVNRAVNTFLAKYGQLPGDLERATQYWGELDDGNVSTTIGTTKTCNGNGDGIIGDNVVGSVLCGLTPVLRIYERAFLFQQISNAELLSEKFGWQEGDLNSLNGKMLSSKSIQNGKISIASSNSASIYITSPVKGGHAMILGGSDTGEDLLPLGLVVEPDFAYSIDSKLDDGNPNTGNVQTEGGLFNLSSTCKDPNDLLVYDLKDNNNKCALVIKADF